MKQYPNMCRKVLQINFTKLSNNSALSVIMLGDHWFTEHSLAYPANLYWNDLARVESRAKQKSV